VVYLLCGAANTLRIAVLVPPFGTLPSSRSLIAAADVAVKGLNERAASLLAGKQLLYDYREVKCDSFASTAAISILLEQGPLDAVIGGFCSTSCESSAFLTAGRDIPQISYGCTSAALSDKEKYPTVRSPLSGFVLACFTMYPFGVSSIVRCAVLADHIDVHQLGACHTSIC
jgi:ABC-type branched-subunit amino acid transport system substrate-binding protein